MNAAFPDGGTENNQNFSPDPSFQSTDYQTQSTSYQPPPPPPVHDAQATQAPETSTRFATSSSAPTCATTSNASRIWKKP